MKRSLQLPGIVSLLVVLTASVPAISGPIPLSFFDVETETTSVASILRADLSQKGDGLLVTGTLRRTHEVKLPGHIDIVICGPNGLIQKQSVSVPGLSSKRKGALNLPFSAQFNFFPPAGSRIILRYHAPGSAPLDESTCVVVSQPEPGPSGQSLFA